MSAHSRAPEVVQGPPTPICLLCLGDCGADGYLTSCNHICCQRCTSRLTPASSPCPVCHRPYQLAPLSTPSLQSLFMDPGKALSTVMRSIGSHFSHHQQAIRRMREALKMIHTKYQQTEQRLQEVTRALRRAEERLTDYETHQQQQQQRWQQQHPSPHHNNESWLLRSASRPPQSHQDRSPLGWAATSALHPGRAPVPPLASPVTQPGTAPTEERLPAFRLSTPMVHSLNRGNNSGQSTPKSLHGLLGGTRP